MTLIHAYQDRGLVRNLQILNVAGSVITPGANDEVMVLIGREGETPKLTITDSTPTANGSSLTKGATCVLRLDASDLALIDPGVYTLFFDYFDNADAKEWKNVDRQVFHLEDT